MDPHKSLREIDKKLSFGNKAAAEEIFWTGEKWLIKATELRDKILYFQLTDQAYHFTRWRTLSDDSTD